MMTVLYFIWICYTVCSLSVIALIVSLAIFSHWDQKKNDQRIREMLTKRPNDLEQ